MLTPSGVESLVVLVRAQRVDRPAESFSDYSRLGEKLSSKFEPRLVRLLHTAI